ncbi:MAG: transporter, partial [Eudoraea sp.]
MAIKKLLFLRNILIGCFILYLQQGFTQDIEPRRWTSIPLGINVVGAGYVYSNGQVKFDPVLELSDVTLEANSFAISYVRPFRIANKLARVDVVVPFSIDHWEGLLSGEPASTNRDGFMDPWARVSVNLIGPPAGGPKEVKAYYQENPVNTTFGVSIE